MVSHGHVQVNGRRMDVASANLRPGDKVQVKERAQSRGLAARFLDLTQIHPVPDWLTVDKDNFAGTVNRMPTREEIQPIVNEQLIVELYSR
jgi:small subunit ribosomal protein S4